MNIQQIRYFMVLCEKGSFAKAADVLYITQQGLNMAISNLESEFSCRLFKRTSKGVSLTEEGEFFKQHADKILTEYGILTDRFINHVDFKHVVRVAACQGILSEFIAELLVKYEETHPADIIDIREFKEKDVDTVVEEERAEFGFSTEPLDTKRFEYHRIYSKPLVLVMHRSHPLAAYDEIPTSALANYPLITLDEAFKSTDFFISECAKQGVKIIPKFRVSEIFAVHRLVIQNMGIGLSHFDAAKTLDTSDAIFRPFENKNLKWNIGIFKKKNYVLSKNARSFYDYVCRHPIILDTDND